MSRPDPNGTLSPVRRRWTGNKGSASAVVALALFRAQRLRPLVGSEPRTTRDSLDERDTIHVAAHDGPAPVEDEPLTPRHCSFDRALHAIDLNHRRQRRAQHLMEGRCQTVDGDSVRNESLAF